MPLKNKRIIIILVVLCLLFWVTFRIVKNTSISTLLWLQTFSISAGDRYQSWLNLYRYQLENHNYVAAKTVEKKLDPATVAIFQAEYYPEIIAVRLNHLLYLPQKTATDWLQIAKYQSQLGLITDAQKSLSAAVAADSIRDDIRPLMLLFSSHP